ncbi:transposase [Arthrobacter sp. UYCu723]
MDRVPAVAEEPPASRRAACHLRCPTGLKKSIGTVFQCAAWQPCRVDFIRNALSFVPKDPNT